MTTTTTTPRAPATPARSTPRKRRTKPVERGHWDSETYVLAPTAAEQKRAKQGESPAAILARAQAKAKREHWEDTLYQQIIACHLPLPERNVYWHPRRRYHSEYVYTDPRDMLIIEVDGGIHLPKGGHTTGKGYEHDRIRDAEALILGYTILRVTPGMIERGEAVSYIERVLHMLWQRRGRKAG